MNDRGGVYEPLTLVRLGRLLPRADESGRWRLVAEFLEEYGWEPVPGRLALLDEEPAGTGDERVPRSVDRGPDTNFSEVWKRGHSCSPAVTASIVLSRLTYAPDLCSEKSLQDQRPEFVA